MTALHFALYAVAALLLAAGSVGLWLTGRARDLAPRALFVGVAVLAASAGVRWVITGHPPIFGTFENTIASSLALACLALVCMRLREPVLASWLPRLVAAWVPVTLAYGLFFPLAPLPLTISERSLVVDVHVLFAWIAYAALVAASMAGVALLVGRRFAERDTDALDEALVVGLGGGFALLTLMIGVGALYSYLLFAEWYRWEIAETFAAAAWLSYGLVMHARLMWGWRGRKLAWAVLAVLPLLVLTFWSWSLYAGTYHHFDITPLQAR